MDALPQVLTLLGLFAVVVVSPGPNFLATTHHAVSQSRRAGIMCALGVAVGTAVWATSALFGLAVILASAGWVYDALRIAGACYLIYVGLKALFGRGKTAAPAAPAPRTGDSPWRAFRAGLLVDLSNPKAATFFTSLFVVMLPVDAPLAVSLATVAAMVAIVGGWYALAATVVSLPPVARAYHHARRWIDRLAGALFVYFGGRLLVGR